MSDLIIAIGSKNPAKISAVEAVVSKAFASVQLTPVAVPSGVAEQPLSAAETEQGAWQRARAALAAVPGARFGIGLEGGVQFTTDGCHAINCCAVASEDGLMHVAWGVRFRLPPPICQRLCSGEELGTVMDELRRHPRQC